MVGHHHEWYFNEAHIIIWKVNGQLIPIEINLAPLSHLIICPLYVGTRIFIPDNNCLQMLQSHPSANCLHNPEIQDIIPNISQRGKNPVGLQTTFLPSLSSPGSQEPPAAPAPKKSLFKAVSAIMQAAKKENAKARARWRLGERLYA